MDIKEVREKIEELEYLITDEIEKLEKETGVIISDIDIQRLNTKTKIVNDDKIVYLLNKVKINVEL